MVQRTSIHIDGFKHANPIPNASRIGNLVVSGVLLGRDSRTGETPAALAAQCTLVFRHMRDTIVAAGGTPDNIIKVNIWLKDPAQRDELNAEWVKMFPNPESRPARHTKKGEGPYLVECDFMAVL